jgi:hypothetical protein
VKLLLVAPAFGNGRPFAFAAQLPPAGVETHVLVPAEPHEPHPPTQAWIHPVTRWNLLALPTALRLAHAEQIDVVLTMSSHFIGAVAKRALGIRWIADAGVPSFVASYADAVLPAGEPAPDSLTDVLRALP